MLTCLQRAGTRAALCLCSLGLAANVAACAGQATPTPVPPKPATAPAVAISPSPAASPSPSQSPAAAGLSMGAFAVLIDNNSDARPQSGLDAADVVYEAPTEGGIPRLMALYLRDTQVERIGPVRSARQYFVYLAAEYHVALAHISGSPQGLAALDETGLPRLDEARGDGGFTRDPSRQAPHDAYVSTQAVRSELARAGTRVSATTAGLSFGAFRPGPQPATRLRIGYGADRFSAQYDYDGGARAYQRSQDDQPHTDAPSGRRYAPRSVIVQQVTVQPIPNDDAGRVDLGLVGTGRGLLVAEGTQVPLQWAKGNLSEATRFSRTDGMPFSVPEGQVWIELVPTDGQVDVSG